MKSVLLGRMQRQKMPRRVAIGRVRAEWQNFLDAAAGAESG